SKIVVVRRRKPQNLREKSIFHASYPTSFCYKVPSFLYSIPDSGRKVKPRKKYLYSITEYDILFLCYHSMKGGKIVLDPEKQFSCADFVFRSLSAHRFPVSLQPWSV
ncbi:MAG: hypothetical protein MJ175_13185, partial [Clostridia bacterium]|nr:hypothetical protein [Clostridia bacterium]